MTLVEVHCTFLPIEARGFCWSIGVTRIGMECRIYPRLPEFSRPVIIETATCLEFAINKAIEKLGDQKPMKPEEKYKRRLR
jgi:hypothetical protein